MTKVLMITENTVIKLYEQFVWEGHEQREICTMIVNNIVAKLSKTKKPHPLKELFLDEEDRGPFYEMVHFVFSTVEDYAKTRPNFNNHLKKG